MRIRRKRCEFNISIAEFKRLCNNIFQPNVLCPAFDDEQNFPPNLDHLRSSNRYAEHENYHLLPTDCGPPSLWDYFVLNHGTTTHLNEYPWMALLRYRTGKTHSSLKIRKNQSYFTSLIFQRTVLSFYVKGL